MKNQPSVHYTFKCIPVAFTLSDQLMNQNQLYFQNVFKICNAYN